MYPTSFRDQEKIRLSQRCAQQITRSPRTKVSGWDPKELDQEEVKLIVHSSVLNAMQHDPTPCQMSHNAIHSSKVILYILLFFSVFVVNALPSRPRPIHP
jgi:hypothetical protein